MTNFTPHQDQALRAVADWLKAKPGKNGTPSVFRLFGYAGTGKTTLLHALNWKEQLASQWMCQAG